MQAIPTHEPLPQHLLPARLPAPHPTQHIPPPQRPALVGGVGLLPGAVPPRPLLGRGRLPDGRGAGQRRGGEVGAQGGGVGAARVRDVVEGVEGDEAAVWRVAMDGLDVGMEYDWKGRRRGTPKHAFVLDPAFPVIGCDVSMRVEVLEVFTEEVLGGWSEFMVRGFGL